MRTRKDRVKDGLHGMFDAQHRELQIKCMAHVIFNDFEQRMFMYQDKVRALCELIAEESMSPEVSSLHFFLLFFMSHFCFYSVIDEISLISRIQLNFRCLKKCIIFSRKNMNRCISCSLFSFHKIYFQQVFLKILFVRHTMMPWR